MYKRQFSNLAVLATMLGAISLLFVQFDATDFTDVYANGFSIYLKYFEQAVTTILDV